MFSSLTFVVEVVVFNTLVGLMIGFTTAPIEVFNVFLAHLYCAALIGTLFENLEYVLCWFLATWNRWIFCDTYYASTRFLSAYEKLRCLIFIFAIYLHGFQTMFDPHQLTVKKKITLVLIVVVLLKYMLPFLRFINTYTHTCTFSVF